MRKKNDGHRKYFNNKESYVENFSAWSVKL